VAQVECPFCGEWIDVWVDPGGADVQEYIEDCSVCCRPIRFVATRESSPIGADERRDFEGNSAWQQWEETVDDASDEAGIAAEEFAVAAFRE